MSLNRIFIVIGWAAILGCVGLTKYTLTLKDQRDQLTNAITISRDSTKHYINRLGEEVARREVIELDKHNLKKLAVEYAEITRHFDGLNKRLSNVESLQKVGIEATKRFEMKPRDTTIINDYGVKMQAWSFKNVDTHFSISGMVILDSAYRKVIATPSLVANIYGAEVYKKPRKKILWLPIGRKTRTFEVTSDNPYIKIGEIEFIRKDE